MSNLRALEEWYNQVVEIQATIQNFCYPKFIRKAEMKDVGTGLLTIMQRVPMGTLICPLDFSIKEGQDIVDGKKPKLTVMNDIIVYNRNEGEKKYIGHCYYLERLYDLGFKPGDIVKIDVLIGNYYYSNGHDYNYCFTGHSWPKRIDNTRDTLSYMRDLTTYKN
jgi:hypothetical protein